MSPGLIFLIGATLLFPTIQSQDTPLAPPMLVEPGVYRIGPGDILNIQVSGEDDLTGDYEVQADGTIRFPFIGAFKIIGMRPAVAAEKLEKALEEDYFVDVQLNLTVKEFRSQVVNVVGEVKKPGKYYLKNYTTLLDVISQAGGLTDDVSDTIILKRQVNENGIPVQKTYPIKTEELLSGDSNGRLASMPLLSGDTIYVEKKKFFFVRGEVNKPGKYQLTEGMTVMEAIAIAGDFAKFADRKKVQIHRRSKDGTQEVIEINLKKIIKNKAENVVLQPGDLLIIQRRFM